MDIDSEIGRRTNAIQVIPLDRLFGVSIIASCPRQKISSDLACSTSNISRETWFFY